ncbi:MAG: hypothetical protein JXR59_04980 [Desulfuromonadaceae bacterium]|nr:hypothetical protein [Desulfuromonadaceae bacterium]
MKPSPALKRLTAVLLASCALLLIVDLFSPPHFPLATSHDQGGLIGLYLWISGGGMVTVLLLTRLLGFLLRRRENYYGH